MNNKDVEMAEQEKLKKNMVLKIVKTIKLAIHNYTLSLLLIIFSN